MQNLNRIVAEGQNDRRARKEAEHTIKQLQEEAESARLKSERALEAARDAHALAVQDAQKSIEKAENANAQILSEARQQMERAVAASLNDQPQRDLSEQKMAELLNEVRNTKDRIEEAIQDATQTRRETTQAHQEATQARQETTRTLPGAGHGRQATAHAVQDITQGRREAAEVEAQIPVRGEESTSQRVAQNRATAVKWVEAKSEGGPLSANKQAGEVLEGVPSNQVVNVLTILGASKQGKSFLMNALTGVDNLFHVSPEASACTAGADLSPILMALPDFQRGSRDPVHPYSGSAHPTIAFVDMEGLGDKSGEHHVRLATPFLIVSKVKTIYLCA